MGDPFGLIGRWLMSVVTGWGLEPTAALTLLRFLGAAILASQRRLELQPPHG